MGRKRYPIEQIIAAVKQHELGTPVPELCRKLGVAQATFYLVNDCGDPGTRFASLRTLWPGLLFANPLIVAMRR